MPDDHSVSNDLRLFEDPQSTTPQSLPVAPKSQADLFLIEVTRSPQRKRSVGARLIGDVLKVVIPSWMSKAEEAHWVRVMDGRFRRKLSTERVDLAERASTLSRRHDLPRPREIRWADNMLNRWGSCTPSTGVIRLSSSAGEVSRLGTELRHRARISSFTNRRTL